MHGVLTEVGSLVIKVVALDRLNQDKLTAYADPRRGEKMINKYVSCVVALAAATCCGLGQAAFLVEDAATGVQNVVPATSMRSNAGLTNLGEPAKSPQLARGLAKDVPLVTALKQIVPEGWRAKRAGNLDVNRLVSWRAQGRSWPEVLQELAVSNNFNVLIDWNKQEVTVAPAEFTASSTEGFRSSGTTTVVAPASRNWDMIPTLTLRENIEAWAKSAGWSVSWAGADYQVSNKVSVVGAFEDEAGGPLAQIAKAYSRSEQPLTFTFYTNNVVRVENSTYRQVNVNDQLPNHRAMQ